MVVIAPLVYRDEDFEHGLMCPGCDHVFIDGEQFSSVLHAFQDDMPICTLMCCWCAAGEAA